MSTSAILEAVSTVIVEELRSTQGNVTVYADQAVNLLGEIQSFITAFDGGTIGFFEAKSSHAIPVNPLVKTSIIAGGPSSGVAEGEDHA